MPGKFATALFALSLACGSVQAAETPGVTQSEIKIGGVFPFSGPASPVGAVGKGLIAYVQFLNDRGGITVNTSDTNNAVWTQMQLLRRNGASWDQFGAIHGGISE